MTETSFVGMEDNEVVGKRGVYADASVMTIMRTRVYFSFRVFWKNFGWRRRGPGGDKVSTSFFVLREFVSRAVRRGTEGVRRKIGVRGTRRSTNAFGDVRVSLFSGTTMIPVSGDAADMWGRQVGHEGV